MDGRLKYFILFGRRRRRGKSKIYGQTYNKKTYKTLGNGTLGKQRSTDPTQEWDRMMTENEHSPVQTRKPSNASIPLDIIHNVPLDPRATIERPLTIPRESHMVTLQRGRVSDSQ